MMQDLLNSDSNILDRIDKRVLKEMIDLYTTMKQLMDQISDRNKYWIDDSQMELKQNPIPVVANILDAILRYTGHNLLDKLPLKL